MKRTRILAALLWAALLPGLLGPALANSAQTHWEGTDAAGGVVTSGSSPIVVEGEVLTFDLAEFPQNYYSDLEAYLAYSGQVTAEYTFHNPAGYTVTARLLFPFGPEPDYSLTYDHETETSYYNADTEKFGVLVDGAPVETALRHTLTEWGAQFDLEEDLALLQEDYRRWDRYFPEQTVTAYTFTASGIDKEANRAATAAFDLQTGGSRAVYFPEQSGYRSLGGSSARLSCWVDNGDTLTVYVIGQALDPFPAWTFYQDGGVEDREQIAGTMTLTGTRQMTYRELALSRWTEASGVSEIDWYNAVTARFAQGDHLSGKWGDLLDLTGSLMRWYEYEITLGPGERLVNTVTAPIYPAIDGSYDPARYTYTYLLSPAQTWSEFGSLEIRVNTPYYLLESGLEGFAAEEGGYALRLEGLPEGELTFTLSASSSPRRAGPSAGYRLLLAPILVWFLLAVTLAVTLGTWLRRRRR